MIKVYGHPMSTCTRKVLMTLAETGLPYELSVVDFAKGEHKQEQHVRRQPFGRVPALEDDGFELFESRAICRYISDKASARLVPGDIKAKAKMEQWISVETSEFSAHAMKFVYEFVFKRQQEASVLEAAGKGLELTCGVLNKQLGQTPFLAGSEFTLADIVFMPYIDYGMTTPVREIFAKYPHFTTWWNTIGARPSWKKATGKA